MRPRMKQRGLTRPLAGFFMIASATAIAAEAPPSSSTVAAACEQVGARLKSVGVKTCLAAGLKPSGVSSKRGVPLVYRDFSPRKPAAGTPPKRVLIIGGIHGDELTSVSITFQWMKRLETDAQQPFHWRVIPSSNPDGLLSKPSTRTNANGVDLNRNFPTADWDEKAISYWKKRAYGDARRYPGKKPMSEVETRWLVEQIASYKPDAIVSIHAPYGVLDYDGPENPPPPKQFGYLRLQPLGIYPGSLGNYGYSLGVPVITLELQSAGSMPSQAEIQKIWNDMLGWLGKNLNKFPVPAETAAFKRGDAPASDKP